ncbi:MAG: acetate/propionate family kinase [Planctomycetaceae bacterium]|nr:acetate/propionate family kinase [Planctomycetaceae bacterium]
MLVLAMNRGSSSLRVASFRFDDGQPPSLQATTKLERIGLDEPADDLLERLLPQFDFEQVSAIGHRVVHGGPNYSQPAAVTDELIAELRRISPFDPDHLPAEMDLVEAIRRRWPRLPQVACFDTAFHRAMPRVARLLPIPRKYDRLGIERYGFHGLSFTYLLEELERTAGPEAARGRVVLAHLGAGVSLGAVRDGKSIDTTMAFTPTAGLPMATRTGDLDPGLFAFLARSEQLTADEFHDMVNHRCGLLGVSETSGDVRDLLANEATDVRASEALAMFCYQARKWIGAMAAALGGLDTLVFSAGIGENSADIRSRICDGLGFLGLEISRQRNSAHGSLISSDASRVAVRVIRTNEELMVAQATCRLVRDQTPGV